MARAPDGHGARVREQRRLVRRQQVRERPQLLEARARHPLELAGDCRRRVEIEQHAAHAAKPAEQHELRFGGLADQRMAPLTNAMRGSGSANMSCGCRGHDIERGRVRARSR